MSRELKANSSCKHKASVSVTKPGARNLHCDSVEIEISENLTFRLIFHKVKWINFHKEKDCHDFYKAKENVGCQTIKELILHFETNVINVFVNIV